MSIPLCLPESIRCKRKSTYPRNLTALPRAIPSAVRVSLAPSVVPSDWLVLYPDICANVEPAKARLRKKLTNFFIISLYLGQFVRFMIYNSRVSSRLKKDHPMRTIWLSSGSPLLVYVRPRPPE